MEWGFEMPHLRPLQPSLMDELIQFCLTGQGRLFLPGTLTLWKLVILPKAQEEHSTPNICSRRQHL
jgi:hypothetical protein